MKNGRGWIRGCLSSASASVLLNGSPTTEFYIRKGVRQGDPLALFLFIIAAESINVVMHEAREKGIFHRSKLPGSGPIISHLQYADDIIFTGDWSLSNVLNLIRILRCFQLSSGLKINLNKSSLLGVGVDDTEVDSFARKAHCKVGSLPFV